MYITKYIPRMYILLTMDMSDYYGNTNPLEFYSDYNIDNCIINNKFIKMTHMKKNMVK